MLRKPFKKLQKLGIVLLASVALSKSALAEDQNQVTPRPKPNDSVVSHKSENDSEAEYEDSIENGNSDDSSPHKIVCVEDETLTVHAEDLVTPLFSLNKNVPVNVMQDFSDDPKLRSIKGVIYKYVQIQVPGREEAEGNSGWVQEKYIRERNDCASYHPPRAPEKKPQTVKADKSVNYGLDDSNCCVFPLRKKPTNEYSEGMARFGAKRSSGRRGSRKHAANDLYLYRGADVLAVKDGLIVRDLYKFYKGTWALEVKHEGGFVVRYGEVRGKHLKGISENQHVEAGQALGLMGKVNSNCCEPMLHFELYKGTESGSLNRKGNVYQRRSDLISPLQKLQLWEDKSL